MQRLQGDGKRNKIVLPRLAEKNLSRIHNSKVTVPNAYDGVGTRYAGRKQRNHKTESNSISVDYTTRHHQRLASMHTPS